MPVSLTRPTLIAYNGYSSGLGNRVRVVLGCQSLAELEGRDFRFVWPTGKLFEPRFSDLWHVEERLVSRATSRMLAYAFPYVDESLTWLTDQKRTERIWQIRTGSPIRLPDTAEPWPERLRRLEPVESIAERVNHYRREFLGDEPYVGVMIRSHTVSHSATRDASPVSWFVERMSYIRSQDPSVRFFVSCDVQEVQDSILARFPGCAAQRDKGPYNSAQAVRAAVVDLYLLAGAGFLLGPHYSSFIHLAEHLAGNRIAMETSMSPAASIDWRSPGIAPDPLKPSVRADVTI